MKAAEAHNVHRSCLCSECGGKIWPELEPSFAFAEVMRICLSCAMRRGGEYDRVDQRWTTRPDVTNLAPDEVERFDWLIL